MSESCLNQRVRFKVQVMLLLHVVSVCMCVCVYSAQIRNVETNQCLDNMARKENEKVGIFNCHGMGGNQVPRRRERNNIKTEILAQNKKKV